MVLDMGCFSIFSSVIKKSFDKISLDFDVLGFLSGKHVFLTGGTGFFGSWLLVLFQNLNSMGFRIQVTVLSRDPDSFLMANSHWNQCSWLSWLAGDVRNFDFNSIHGVDYIIHAATDTSSLAQKKPLNLLDTIVKGSDSILRLAVANKSRVLLIGSGAQYGELMSNEPVDEAWYGACSSFFVNDVYAEAKRVQEMLGACYINEFGLEVVAARCFSFAGPGLPLNGHFAIGNFVRDALYSDKIIIKSSGIAVRSYLHGADLAVWLLVLLGRGKSGTAYNVGSDDAVTIYELARRILGKVSPAKEVVLLGEGGGGREYYVPSIKSATELGLKVWNDLDDSIDGMLSWEALSS